MTHEPFSGILFDMDGVLFDSEDLIAEAGCRLFREKYGQEVAAEAFLPFVGTGERRYLGGVAQQFGITLDIPVDKALVYGWYLDMIPGRLRILPGARDFVAACRAGGLRTAVATSADRIKMEGNLREAGWLDGTFDALVTGSDMAHAKPAPDIFLTAADRLDLAPAQCLVIEDAVSGIQAAVAAGCRCLALTTSFPEEVLLEAGADRVIPDLSHAGDPCLL